jgi:hypothetical protein
MKSEMILRRDGGTLRPDGDESWEVMDKIAHGASVVVTVRKSRNVEQLRLYWVMCAFVADFDPEFTDRNDVDTWLRMSVPWMREELTLGDGRVRVKLRSISIDEMEQVAPDALEPAGPPSPAAGGCRTRRSRFPAYRTNGGLKPG